MHSVQCFHAQHAAFHVQHEMSFKGWELRILQCHNGHVHHAYLPIILSWWQASYRRVSCVKLHGFTLSDPPTHTPPHPAPSNCDVWRHCMFKHSYANSSECHGSGEETTAGDSLWVLSCVSLTARSVWSCCSPSTSAKSTSPWSPTRTRSGRFSSIRSSSSSLWVANTVPQQQQP